MAKSALPYAAMIIVISTLAFIRPYDNADMVGYIACTIPSNDFQQINRDTYSALESSVVPRHFRLLTGLNPGEQNRHAKSTELAEVQLFYSIKPLYIIAIQVLHLFGISSVRATYLISALGYLGAGWLLWKWIGWPAYVVMIAPPIIGLVRYSTPDGMNLLLAMTGFYLIGERRWYVRGAAFLLVCVWVRPDMLILSGLTFVALWLTRKIDFVELCTLSVLAVISYWTIMHVSGNYGWSVLFAHSFYSAAHVTTPGEQIFHITPQMYITTFFNNLRPLELVNLTDIGAVQSGLAIFVLLATLAIKRQRDPVYRALTLATLFSMAIHYLLFPSPDFRYFAPMSLFQVVSFVCSFEPNGEAVSTEGGEAGSILKDQGNIDIAPGQALVVIKASS